MVIKTLAEAFKNWPTADLAELFLLVRVQLDKRAAHAKGGGVEAEVAKRSKLPRAKVKDA